VSEPVFDIAVVLRALSDANPDGHTGCIELWRKSADEIESLRSRLAAAEANDRRYRWLREKPGRLANIHTEGLALWNERQDITGAEAVDDAIDAHLAGEKP
jgi:hypothetical protein